jgi:hypothetical protein
MRDVDPAASEDNPVTRVLNMVLTDEEMLEPRKGFVTIGGVSFAADVNNHITTEFDGDTHLIVKRDAAIDVSINAGAFAPITVATDDPPLSAGVPKTGVRGSFAIFNGEVYYCDEDTVVRYDGTQLDRPGVVSLDGFDYNRTAPGMTHPAFDTGIGAFGISGVGMPADKDAAYGPPFGVAEDYPGQTDRPSVLNPAFDPFIIALLWQDAVNNTPITNPNAWKAMGQKTLNTAFAIAYYDPKRRIFGKRTDVFALPYIFAGGPVPDPDLTLPQLLSNARTQYSKCVRTPDTPAGHGGYQVAIWFTRGFLPAANASSAVSGGWWVVSLWSPAMSKEMNEMLFLEGLFPAGLRATTSDNQGTNRAVCKKDDNKLFASGRYLDVYARPLPSKHFTILPSGTALYVFPRLVPTQADEQALDLSDGDLGAYPDFASLVEYSVGHPEQVGRNTLEQRDTTAPIGNYSGEIKAILPQGLNPLMVTRTGLYTLGFDGRAVTVAEVVGGYGCRDAQSISEGAAGTFWIADDGVVWMRGQKIVLLDKELGFGRWFDIMTGVQKNDVRIGACDTLSQILVFHDVATVGDPIGERALVYDYARQFVSEFRGADITGCAGGYVAFVPHNHPIYPGQLITPTGAYPNPTQFLVDAEGTEVEMWISDQVHKPKRLGFMELKIGPKSVGTIDITVEAHDATEAGTEPLINVQSISTSVANAASAVGQKIRIPDFIGMRGRMFKITMVGVQNFIWRLAEVKVEYDVDEEDDIRSN